MKKVLQIIKENDLLKRGKPNLDKIQTLSLSQIVDIANQLDSAVTCQYERTESTFSFSSSLELGASSGCSEFECRKKRLDKLSRFALMYSDKVYIGSFFSAISDFINTESPDPSNAQYHFYCQIGLIKFIEPLLNKGYISMYPLPSSFCKDCINKILFKDRNERRVDKVLKNIEQDILSSISVKAFLEENDLACDFAETLPYLKCGMTTGYYNIPQPILNRPRIYSKLKRGQAVLLSKTLIKDLGYHKDLASELLMNVLFGLLTSKTIGSSFLTEDSVHIDLMNSLNPENDIRRKNSLAQKYLTSTVPFVEDVKLKDLMKLRENEGDAFLIYKQALDQAMTELKDSNSNFKAKDAKELYSDVIAPSIAKMNQRVKTARKTLLQETYRPALGLVGSISFGLLSGIIPSETAAIASAVGATSCGADMLKKIMTLGDSEKAIQNEPFYFLWKVKQKVKKRSKK